MTNQIQFPTSYSSGIAVDSLFLLDTVKSGSSDTIFQELFSTMLTSSSQFPKSEKSGSMSFDLSPILLLLIAKLFGEQNINANSLLLADSPQGVPVIGKITQGSHDGHSALDFGVPVGTEVHTTMEGKVAYAGWNNEGYGNLVIIENGQFRTYYAHLSSVPVKVGQIVKDGDIIGLSGNTGNSTGPHLHYEIRKNGVAINPTDSLAEN